MPTLSVSIRTERPSPPDKKVEFYPKFGDSLLYQHHTTSLVFNDAPLHTRVRRAIAGALSPRAIAGMDVVVQQLVDGLIEDLEARHRAGMHRSTRWRISRRTSRSR